MEMRPRKFGIRLTYNGADAADEITADLLDFSYSDALEESDSASITLKDDRGRWAGAWTPRTGDRIDPVICLENWGKDRIPELNCGRTAPGYVLPVRISREAPAGGSLCTGGYSFYRDEAVTDLGIGDDLPGSGGDRFPVWSGMCV